MALKLIPILMFLLNVNLITNVAYAQRGARLQNTRMRSARLENFIKNREVFEKIRQGTRITHQETRQVQRIAAELRRAAGLGRDALYEQELIDFFKESKQSKNNNIDTFYQTFVLVTARGNITPNKKAELAQGLILLVKLQGRENFKNKKESEQRNPHQKREQISKPQQASWTNSISAGWFRIGSLKNLLNQLASSTGVEITMNGSKGIFGRKIDFSIRGEHRDVLLFRSEFMKFYENNL